MSHSTSLTVILLRYDLQARGNAFGGKSKELANSRAPSLYHGPGIFPWCMVLLGIFAVMVLCTLIRQ
jgi:hypothetical protein